MKKLLLIFCLLLSGCAATGPNFKPVEPTNEKNGILYVYRETGMAFSVRAAYFYINDVNIFDLNLNGYSWVELPAGKYKLKQKWAADISFGKFTELDIEILPGQSQYVSFQTGGCNSHTSPGVICLAWTIQRQPNEIGQYAITEKKFQDNFGQEKLKQK